MDYSKIITNILDRYNIQYWTEGKNVSKDSINIRCPFYDCDDHSNHMGIFTDTLKFHCWKCNHKGYFSYLLSILIGKSKSQCQEIIEEEKLNLGFSDLDIPKKKKEKRLVTPLPEYFEEITENTNFPLLFKYIRRRKLSLKLLIEKKCGVCKVGPYMNRLIIPVFHNGKQVSFVAADMTGTAFQKYINAGIAMENYLYGYDDVVGDTLVVVEGILDAWRVGNEAVAILHSYISDKQKNLIIKKNPKNLIFCLDGDAYWHARDEAAFFEPFIDQVKVIHMNFDEDPDSLGTDRIWEKIEKSMFFEYEEIDNG